MIRSAQLLAISSLIACTYNEYHSSGQGGESGAGPVSRAGASGTSGGGENGGAGGDGEAGGSSGSGPAAAGAAGAGSGDTNACAGCLQLELPANRESNVQLEFASNRDFSDTTIAWRVRIRDFVSEVSITVYAENADPDLSVSSNLNLNASAGWQDVGLDLSAFDEFRAPLFTDAGGFAGGGFNPGNPFDKSKIRAIGLKIQPGAPGIFTPAQIDVDAITFSDLQSQNIDFSEDAADVELVDSDGSRLTHAPE